MDKEKVPDNPTCPLCEREVFPGDSVIFSQGETVHIKCRVTNDGIGDSLAHLLRRNAGAEYCQSCVARVLHATYEQAMKAVTTLRMSSRYHVRAMGRCSVCGNRWMTIKAEPRLVGAGTSERSLTAPIAKPRPALVLVVDDDPEIRGLLTEFLRVKGYQSFAAMDAEEALNLMAAAPPDVVLLDTNLPRIGSISVLRRIHTLYPSIPDAIEAAVASRA